MKYMVMECHLSYAVVLDEAGRFLKVANKHYEVGQTVTDITPMQVPQSVPQKKKTNKWMYSLAAMAACLVLVVTSVFQIGQMTYASVYMTINPEVRIDVNRNDVVVGLDGINPDGDDLITGYDYRKKNLDLVMDELVDRAIDMGYLHEGGQISLVLDAESNEWVISHSDTLTIQLNEHLNEKLSVTIEVTDKKEQSNQVIIPVVPEESDYGESDYGDTNQPTTPPISSQPTDSNYGDSSYDEGETDYGNQDDFEDAQSDYGGQSDYADTDSNQSNYASDDGQSDYSDQTDTNVSDYVSDDGQSDYAVPEAPDDGQSEYITDDGQSGYEESNYSDDAKNNASDYETDDD